MGGIAKIVDKIYSSNIGQKLANPTATAATATLIATVSNVSKDAVNCAYYTVQSLNNEKIPEDKRKFVAALDLSNGIMNVATQLLSTFVLTKLILSIFDNHIAKSKAFSDKEDVIKEKYQSLTKELKAKMSEADFVKNYKKHIGNKRALARTGFSVLVANIAMQILLKRIITPLFATPMASVFKKKFEAADEKKPEQEPKNNKIATA